MGLFDTFTVYDFICPNCGHLNEENELQTKDFENLLDHIKEGEDVRDNIESWHTHDGGMFRHKLTKTKATSMAIKSPHKYKVCDISDNTSNHLSWILYKHAGKRRRNFSWVRYGEFELHGGCENCTKSCSVTGYIEDYIFKGVK